MSDATGSPHPAPPPVPKPSPSRRDAVLSVLTSRTIWLAILTGVAAPIARACGTPEAIVSDELIGALATVATLIVAARSTTSRPLTARLPPSSPAPP